ncbi:MAG: DCC1-like thiol-disulfide oxidoreductase family protein [Planctomycetota bacterium]|mgnify:CR=1 FL=1
MTDLLLYDGVCGICNRLTQFILARDNTDRFRFASLQGELARDILPRYGRNADDMDTVYVVVDYGMSSQRVLWKGRAILHVLRSLGGVWKLSVCFGILPTVLLDMIYSFVARRRYRWFGRHETCPIPPASQRAKFLG